MRSQQYSNNEIYLVDYLFGIADSRCSLYRLASVAFTAFYHCHEMGGGGSFSYVVQYHIHRLFGSVRENATFCGNCSL